MITVHTQHSKAHSEDIMQLAACLHVCVGTSEGFLGALLKGQKPWPVGHVCPDTADLATALNAIQPITGLYDMF